MLVELGIGDAKLGDADCKCDLDIQKSWRSGRDREAIGDPWKTKKGT